MDYVSFGESDFAFYYEITVSVRNEPQEMTDYSFVPFLFWSPKERTVI